MRCSSALVLGALVAGQAAAANPRHAGFHARRNAEKREAVNWAKVVYDLSGVDWSKVFATMTSTPVGAPTPASTPAAKAEQAPAPPAITSAPAYTPAAKPATPSASSKNDDNNNPIGKIGAVLSGLESVVSRFGVTGWTTGWNNDTDNGFMWFGDDSQWKVTFTNGANDDISLWCWDKSTALGGTVIKNQPIITTTIPVGESTTLSWAGGVGSACAAIYPNTQPSFWGGISNSIFEVTFKDPAIPASVGTFDVSYETDMSGNDMTAVGSQCTSDKSTCVFKCTNGQPTCMDKGTYALLNCSPANGGGSDSAQENGGCNTANDAEHIKVTFH